MFSSSMICIIILPPQNRGAPAQPAAAPAAAAPANGAAAPNGASGGADYSAQWAEYYRSVGKHKEAEAIEAQIKQKVQYQKGYGEIIGDAILIKQ